MKTTFLITFILFFFQASFAQEVDPQFIETQATITSVESKISGKRPRSIVAVNYVIETGDTLSSQLQLDGIPFIGSSKEVGDTLTILYQKDNPYLIKSKSDSFLQSYGLYILIAFGLLFTGYKFLRRKKTV